MEVLIVLIISACLWGLMHLLLPGRKPPQIVIDDAILYQGWQVCPACGAEILGDGITSVKHCEKARVEDYWDLEPDPKRPNQIVLCPCDIPGLMTKKPGKYDHLLPKKEDIKADFIRIIQRGYARYGQTVAKTNVLSMVTGKYCQYRRWEGISPLQEAVAEHIKQCLAELIHDGKVRYIPRKPLQIIQE